MRGLPAAALSALLALAALGQGAPRPEPGADRPSRRPDLPPEAGRFLTDVPPHPGTVVLGRPTASGITLSLLWHGAAEGLLVWGNDPVHLLKEGRRVTLAPGEPLAVRLDGLKPDATYTYALLDAATGRRLLPVAAPGAFHTARRPGQPFTFTIQADAHLDGSCSTELYQRALANALADRPDFHIDLGDTFMTEKHADRASAAAQYAAQRYHLGQLAHSAPLFLVLGNHDGEGLDRRGQVPADGLAVWSHTQRTRLFPNPEPDAFYSGTPARLPGGGPMQSHYAWTWGDALFVVLDPYWTSLPTRGGREPWNTTLGTAQYRWLAETLRASKARHKFVFIHQLTGSDHPAGRGGAEASAYQEWGGLDLDRSDAFARHRPGWEKPVHALLVETRVTAVFHGHDHFYAQQTRDGVVYQLVPQPAHRNDRSHHAEEYGYRQGHFLSASGHLRVRVTPERVTVDYVRAALPEQERRGARNGEIQASYQVPADGRP